jgi:hypothetical protein
MKKHRFHRWTNPMLISSFWVIVQSCGEDLNFFKGKSGINNSPEWQFTRSTHVAFYWVMNSAHFWCLICWLNHTTYWTSTEWDHDCRHKNQHSENSLESFLLICGLANPVWLCTIAKSDTRLWHNPTNKHANHSQLLCTICEWRIETKDQLVTSFATLWFLKEIS